MSIKRDLRTPGDTCLIADNQRAGAIQLRVSRPRMLLHVDVAVRLSADVAGPVIAEPREETLAKVADSPLRLLPLANQRSSCTGWGAGRSVTPRCCRPLPSGRRDGW